MNARHAPRFDSRTLSRLEAERWTRKAEQRLASAPLLERMERAGVNSALELYALEAQAKG